MPQHPPKQTICFPGVTVYDINSRFYSRMQLFVYVYYAIYKIVGSSVLPPNAVRTAFNTEATGTAVYSTQKTSPALHVIDGRFPMLLILKSHGAEQNNSYFNALAFFLHENSMMHERADQNHAETAAPRPTIPVTVSNAVPAPIVISSSASGRATRWSFGNKLCGLSP